MTMTANEHNMNAENIESLSQKAIPDSRGKTYGYSNSKT